MRNFRLLGFLYVTLFNSNILFSTPPPGVNTYKSSELYSIEEELDFYRWHGCWIGGGWNASGIPVWRNNVVLDERNNTLKVRDLLAGREGQAGGGIYKITVDNSAGHVGVIDFNGLAGKTLFFDELNIAEDGYLVIRNLGNNRIAGQSRTMSESKLRSVTIDVNGELMDVRHYWPGKHWWCEHTDYRVIVPTYNLWTPIPEPGTYGAIFAALGVGVASFRRKRGGKRLS